MFLFIISRVFRCDKKKWQIVLHECCTGMSIAEHIPTKSIASVLSEFLFCRKFLTSLSSSFFVHALAACIVHFTSAML